MVGLGRSRSHGSSKSIRKRKDNVLAYRLTSQSQQTHTFTTQSLSLVIHTNTKSPYTTRIVMEFVVSFLGVLYLLRVSVVG